MPSLASRLDRQGKLRILAANWELNGDIPQIRGVVHETEEGFRLQSPRNADGKPLSYPSDAETPSTIQEAGVPIRDPQAKSFEGEEVSARIGLASEEQQRQRGNPWLVEATEIAGRIDEAPQSEASSSAKRSESADAGPADSSSHEPPRDPIAESNNARQIFQSAKQSPAESSSQPGDGEKGNETRDTDSAGQTQSDAAFSGGLLTVEQAAQLEDAERMSYLMQQWELEHPILRGTLQKAKKLPNATLWEIVDVHDREGNALSYPVKGLKGKRARSFFAGINLSHSVGAPVEAHFKLSADDNARKHNPLAIKLKAGTIKQLQSIPEAFVRSRGDGGIAVEQSLYDYHVEQKKEQIKEEVAEATADLDAQLSEKEEQLAEVREELGEAQSRRSQSEEEAAEAEEKASRLEEKAEELERGISTLYEERNRKQAEIDREIEEQRHQAQQQKAQLMNDVFKLRNYVTRRADQLHRLDLISDDQRENLIDDTASRTSNEGALSFSGDLDGDFGRLVDHVQAYLLDDGILYPRFLLEDFLTLLRTRDLVVLSGLSGSGKTQLVHSFADAVGGKAHVIPVKPNWTSSEDLLGYYNPLQKSYLTTPFLDALIEARRDPGRLHLICLDEMNLSRVEYYFADFLSKLEERKETPALPLYSTEEAGHVEAEFRALMGVIDEAEDQQNGEVHENFGELLRDEEISGLLQERLGIENGKSFVELHAHLRRMLAGVLNVPAKLPLPENVRFIGAINMDQTTNALATKVLDRAHVVRFESPMTYDWEQIQEESKATGAEAAPVHLPAPQFTPQREPYPRYHPGDDDLAEQLVKWTDDYLRPIGIDIGLRTVRQAINYRDLLRQAHVGEDDTLYTRALNSILLRKILPRFSFEGKRPVSDPESPDTRHERVQSFRSAVRSELSSLDEETSMPHAARELDRLIEAADQSGATIYNYWS